MNWQQVCIDPNLQNLPYKIELNKQGQIIMSPASVKHVFYQREILLILEKMISDGKAVPEFPMETDEGTKVVDVAWLTNEQANLVKEDISSSVAPKICVEVISPSNTIQEMMNKKKLYFDRGAEEFWLCEKNGDIKFYGQIGELKKSQLAPDFPKSIEV
jgi:Uma2 family endonuclease